MFRVFFKSKWDSKLDVKVKKKITNKPVNKHKQKQIKTWIRLRKTVFLYLPVWQAGHSFNHILLSKCYCLCNLGGGSCGSCMFQESCAIFKCYFLSLEWICVKNQHYSKDESINSFMKAEPLWRNICWDSSHNTIAFGNFRSREFLNFSITTMK